MPRPLIHGIHYQDQAVLHIFLQPDTTVQDLPPNVLENFRAQVGASHVRAKVVLYLPNFGAEVPPNVVEATQSVMAPIVMAVCRQEGTFYARRFIVSFDIWDGEWEEVQGVHSFEDLARRVVNAMSAEMLIST